MLCGNTKFKFSAYLKNLILIASQMVYEANVITALFQIKSHRQMTSS